MDKLFEKLRKPLSYITLIALVAIAFIVGIGQSVVAGTFYIASFALASVLGVCLLLYIIGTARNKEFPIIVSTIIVLFIFLLNPFINATMFEMVGAAFNDNAALGLAEILYIIMVLGGVAVLVLYLLEGIFGLRLSIIIKFILLGLVAVGLTYYLLQFIGVIISLANDGGSFWFEFFSSLMLPLAYVFVLVNFGVLESKTKNA